MNAPRLIIAGIHSGSGKTTMTLALLASLHGRGRRVQVFKIGPDFIDPGHYYDTYAICLGPSCLHELGKHPPGGT